MLQLNCAKAIRDIWKNFLAHIMWRKQIPGKIIFYYTWKDTLENFKKCFVFIDMHWSMASTEEFFTGEKKNQDEMQNRVKTRLS